MKILFVSREVHARAHASDVFLDMLEGHEVEVFDFDETAPDRSVAGFLDACGSRRFDLVIVWKCEVLALVSLAMSIPTVIVPLIGSLSQPGKHWRALSDASIVNLSYNVHIKTRETFANHLLVKYFPNPGDFPLCAPDEPTAVIVRLRHARDMNTGIMSRLGRQATGRIHLHMPPADIADIEAVPAWIAERKVTRSGWFTGKRDFDELIRQFGIAVVPRVSDGICMFMLEAMARGMCVMASNEADHNEYVCDRVNGHLLNPDDDGPTDLRFHHEIGDAARKSVVAGYDRWREHVDDIKRFLVVCAANVPSPLHTPADAKRLIELYFSERNLYYQALPDQDVTGPLAGDEINVRRLAVAAGLPPRVNHVQLGRLDNLRLYINRIPGWSFAKKMIPNNMKRKLARRLME